MGNDIQTPARPAGGGDSDRQGALSQACNNCRAPIDGSAVEVNAYGKCGTLCARCMATALFGKKCDLCEGFGGELVKHGETAWTHPECDARRANRWHKCGTCSLRTDDPATVGFLSATQCRSCVALRERYADELRERALAGAGR